MPSGPPSHSRTSAQVHPRDADPGKIARFVEFDDLDDAAHRRGPDLPVHFVAGPDSGWTVGEGLPPLQVRHESWVAVRIADHFPHGVAGKSVIAAQP